MLQENVKSHNHQTIILTYLSEDCHNNPLARYNKSIHFSSYYNLNRINKYLIKDNRRYLSIQLNKDI
jgi:hypothetical protein